MPVSMTRLPPFTLGAGARSSLQEVLKQHGQDGALLCVIDAFWAETEIFHRLRAGLEDSGLSVHQYSGFTGEPKAADIRKACDIARSGGVTRIVGLGGGTALDSAKLISACAATGKDPEHYALGRNPLPCDPLPTVLIPTTAGTGSEANGNSIFSNDAGKKLWAFSFDMKATHALLDPDLTASLPPQVAAWSGMDALVHAFEAATNRLSHPVAQPFALRALGLIHGALERAVTKPSDEEARTDLLLGSFYAGYAIENCGTSVAHNVSHALAGLAPVHHGLATALAFERTLPFVLSAGTDAMDKAAKACGASGIADLPGRISALMDRLGIARALPDAFAGFSAADLAHEMRTEENAPMRNACRPDMTDHVVERIAEDTMTLAPGVAS